MRIEADFEVYRAPCSNTHKMSRMLALHARCVREPRNVPSLAAIVCLRTIESIPSKF
jgi:hypothetical protein